MHKCLTATVSTLKWVGDGAGRHEAPPCVRPQWDSSHLSRYATVKWQWNSTFTAVLQLILLWTVKWFPRMQSERGDACASSDLRWRSRRCCSRSAPYPARSRWPRRTSATAKPAGRTECNSKPLRVHFENMTDTDLWRRRAQQRGFHPAHTLTSHFIRYISLGSSSLLPFCGLQLVCSIFSDLWPFYFSTQLLLARSFLFLGSFSVNTESLPMWQTGKFAIHVYEPLIISPSKEGWWVRSLIFHCDYSECKNIRLLDQTPTSIKLHFAWYIQ